MPFALIVLGFAFFVTMRGELSIYQGFVAKKATTP